MSKLIITIFAVFCVSQLNATTFTVTNTNNSGAGSLRDAIQQAAITNGPHTINFNIPTTDPNYNSSTGVWVITPQSTFTFILKNYVTIDGTSQTANQGDTNPYGPEIVLDGNNNTINYCFSVYNASNVVIKGFNIRRFMYGIQITGTTADYGTITGNYIGTNETATDTAGNYIGIEIIAGADYTTIGGTMVTERNIVSGNQHIGIRLLDVNYCVVKGNYVGVNRTGTAAVKNYDGVSLEGAVKFSTIGGTTSAERNIISGNEAYGLPVFGAGAEGNNIKGNYIGTDVTGTFAIPNTYGVLFDDGSYENILGGNTAAERNIISGNSGYGVFIYNMGTHANEVRGNYIGTDVTGEQAIPNAIGIVIDGAAFDHIIDNNIISSNLQQGIYINITGCDGTVITKNKIGLTASGNALGNGSDGIRISQGPKYSVIGGSVSDANTIANNGGAGVYIMFANDDYHLISYNSFYNNSGLAVDLFPPGVNTNDAGDGDNGPNQELNYPEIDSVRFSAGQTRVYGYLDTPNPQNCEVQIYKSSNDASGHGEGMQYLSSAIPNSSGIWSDTISGLSVSDFITTLAIDANYNTSEFSIYGNSTTFAGIAESYRKSNSYVFPNPGNDFLTIKINRDSFPLSVNMFNSEGKLVKTKELLNLENILMETNDLPEGLYTLQIIYNNNIEYLKWIKTKK
jgi:hypothetical protein